MTKRKPKNLRQVSRLNRIERKCDRILSELLIMRHRLNYRTDIDVTIDRLHHTARMMRAACEKERDNMLRMFNSKHME